MGDSGNRTMCMDTAADHYKTLIEETAKELAPELKKLALDIHDNPELGHQEFKACGWQAELLRNVLSSADKRFLIVDSTKFNRRGLYRISAKGGFDAIFTADSRL